jgi:hypothetical protein
VKLRGGRIVSINRTKKLTAARQKPPHPAALAVTVRNVANSAFVRVLPSGAAPLQPSVVFLAKRHGNFLWPPPAAPQW